MHANAIVPEGIEPWYKLFDALQYVTNPYALLAFLFLIVVAGIGFFDMRQRFRAIALAVLAGMILAMTGLLLNGSLSEVERHAMIPLVNDGIHNHAEVAPGVMIELLDTTSFRAGVGPRGGGGQAHNRNFPLGVWSGVFLRANILSETPERARRMRQEQWDRFLATLTPREEGRLLEISFVRLRVSVAGRQVEDRFWFRGGIVRVRSNLSFRIANVYNTHEDSGEPEAINLQPLT